MGIPQAVLVLLTPWFQLGSPLFAGTLGPPWLQIGQLGWYWNQGCFCILQGKNEYQKKTPKQHGTICLVHLKIWFEHTQNHFGILKSNA